jgi:hypothetical protein
MPQPETVPHPDELVIDPVALTVKCNGPWIEDEKAIWDSFVAEREELIQESGKLNAKARRFPKLKAECEAQVEANLERLDALHSAFPEARFRRVPGFDLEDWRDAHKALAKLKKALS